MRKLYLFLFFYSMILCNLTFALYLPAYKPVTVPGNNGVYISRGGNDSSYPSNPVVVVFNATTSIDSNGLCSAKVDNSKLQDADSKDSSGDNTKGIYVMHVYNAQSNQGDSSQEVSLDPLSTNYFMLNGGDLLYPTSYTDNTGPGGATQHYIGSISINMANSNGVNDASNSNTGTTAGTNELQGYYTRKAVPFVPHFFITYQSGLLNISDTPALPPKTNPNTGSTPKPSLSVDFYSPAGTGGSISNVLYLQLSNWPSDSKNSRILGVIPINYVVPNKYIFIVCYSVPDPTTKDPKNDKFVADLFELSDSDIASYNVENRSWSNNGQGEIISPISTETSSGNLNYTGESTEGSVNSKNHELHWENTFSNWYLGGYPSYSSQSYPLAIDKSGSNENKYGLCLVANKLTDSAQQVLDNTKSGYNSGYYYESIFIPINISSDAQTVSLETPVDASLCIPNGVSWDSFSTTSTYVNNTSDYARLRMIVFDFLSADPTVAPTDSNDLGEIPYAYMTPLIYAGNFNSSKYTEGGNMDTKDSHPNIALFTSQQYTYDAAPDQKIVSAITASSAQCKDNNGSFMDIPPLLGIIMGWPPFPAYVWWYYSSTNELMNWWGQHLFYRFDQNEYQSKSHEYEKSFQWEAGIDAMYSVGIEVGFLGDDVSISHDMGFQAYDTGSRNFATTSTHLNNLNSEFQEIPPGLFCDPHIGWAVFMNGVVSSTKVEISSAKGDQFDFGSGGNGYLTTYVPNGAPQTGYDIQYFDLRHPELSPYPAVRWLLGQDGDNFAHILGIDTPTTKGDFSATNPDRWAEFAADPSHTPLWRKSGAAVYNGGVFSANFGIVNSLGFTKESSDMNSTMTGYFFAVNGGPGLPLYANTQGSFTNTWTATQGDTWDIGFTYETMVPNAFANISGNAVMFIPGDSADLSKCTWMTKHVIQSGSAPWLLTFENIFSGPTVDENGNPLPVPTIEIDQAEPKTGQKYANNNTVYSTYNVIQATQGKVTPELVLLVPDMQYRYYQDNYELAISNGSDAKGNPLYYYIINPSSGTETDSIVVKTSTVTPDSFENNIYNNYSSNLVSDVEPNGNNSFTITFAPKIQLTNTQEILNYRHVLSGTLSVGSGETQSNQEIITFLEDSVDNNIYVLYNSTLWILNNSGINKYTSTNFSSVNCIASLDGTIYIGTDDGIFFGSSLNNLSLYASTQGQNIVSISFNQNMIVYSYSNSNGSTNTSTVYQISSTAVSEKVPVSGDNLTSGSGVSYGNITETPLKITTINGSDLYLYTVVNTSTGKPYYYISAPIALYNYADAVNSRGGIDLFNKYSALELSDTSLAADGQIKYANNEESLVPNPNQYNTFAVNLSDGAVLNIFMYYENISDSLIVQSYYSGGDSGIKTYIFTDGFIPNQIIYNNCDSINFPIMSAFNRNGIFYLSSGSRIYAASIENYKLNNIGVIYSANKNITITSMKEDKDPNAIYFDVMLSNSTSVQVPYLSLGMTGSVPIVSSSTEQESPASFVYYPDASVSFVPGYDPTNLNPIQYPNSPMDPVVAYPFGFITGPSSLPKLGETSTYRVNAYGSLNSPLLEKYYISFQNTYDTANATEYTGTYFNTLKYFLYGDYESEIDYAYKTLNDAGDNIFNTISILSSAATINSFIEKDDLLGGEYFYVNYKGDNQNTIYVYYINKNISFSLRLVGYAVLSSSIDYILQNGTTGYVAKYIDVSKGSRNMPYFYLGIATSGYNTINYSTLPLYENISNSTNSTQTPYTSIISKNILPYTNTQGNIVKPNKDSYIIQNSLPFSGLSTQVFGESKDGYLIQTLDGSLILESDNIGQLLYLAGGINPSCTSISYNASNTGFIANITSGTTSYELQINTSAFQHQTGLIFSLKQLNGTSSQDQYGNPVWVYTESPTNSLSFSQPVYIDLNGEINNLTINIPGYENSFQIADMITPDDIPTPWGLSIYSMTDSSVFVEYSGLYANIYTPPKNVTNTPAPQVYIPGSNKIILEFNRSNKTDTQWDTEYIIGSQSTTSIDTDPDTKLVQLLPDTASLNPVFLQELDTVTGDTIILANGIDLAFLTPTAQYNQDTVVVDTDGVVSDSKVAGIANVLNPGTTLTSVNGNLQTTDGHQVYMFLDGYIYDLLPTTNTDTQQANSYYGPCFPMNTSNWPFGSSYTIPDLRIKNNIAYNGGIYSAKPAAMSYSNQLLYSLNGILDEYFLISGNNAIEVPISSVNLGNNTKNSVTSLNLNTLGQLVYQDSNGNTYASVDNNTVKLVPYKPGDTLNLINTNSVANSYLFIPLSNYSGTIKKVIISKANGYPIYLMTDGTVLVQDLTYSGLQSNNGLYCIYSPNGSEPIVQDISESSISTNKQYTIISFVTSNPQSTDPYIVALCNANGILDSFGICVYNDGINIGSGTSPYSAGVTSAGNALSIFTKDFIENGGVSIFQLPSGNFLLISNNQSTFIYDPKIIPTNQNPWQGVISNNQLSFPNGTSPAFLSYCISKVDNDGYDISLYFNFAARSIVSGVQVGISGTSSNIIINKIPVIFSMNSDFYTLQYNGNTINIGSTTNDNTDHDPVISNGSNSSGEVFYAFYGEKSNYISFNNPDALWRNESNSHIYYNLTQTLYNGISNIAYFNYNNETYYLISMENGFYYNIMICKAEVTFGNDGKKTMLVNNSLFNITTTKPTTGKEISVEYPNNITNSQSISGIYLPISMSEYCDCGIFTTQEGTYFQIGNFPPISIESN